MRRVEAEPSQLGTLLGRLPGRAAGAARHEELPERVEAAPVGLLELDDLVDPRGGGVGALGGERRAARLREVREDGAAAPNAAAGGAGGASRAARGGRATAS